MHAKNTPSPLSHFRENLEVVNRKTSIRIVTVHQKPQSTQNMFCVTVFERYSFLSCGTFPEKGWGKTITNVLNHVCRKFVRLILKLSVKIPDFFFFYKSMSFDDQMFCTSADEKKQTNQKQNKKTNNTCTCRVQWYRHKGREAMSQS